MLKCVSKKNKTKQKHFSDKQVQTLGKNWPKHHRGVQSAQSTTRPELAAVWPLTLGGGGYLAGSPRGTQIKCYITCKWAGGEAPKHLFHRPKQHLSVIVLLLNSSLASPGDGIRINKEQIKIRRIVTISFQHLINHHLISFIQPQVLKTFLTLWLRRVVICGSLRQSTKWKIQTLN